MGSIAVIGGSGVYQLEGGTLVKEHAINTPFGAPSDAIFEVEFLGNSYFFLPRHGRHHHLLPSEVNYRANIYSLKSLGVDQIISVSAVGSLKEQYAPGDFVFVDQFIDWTKGKRNRTFFENGMVAHVSCANPIELALQNRLKLASHDLNTKCHEGGTYICIEGPQFSTKAESHLYRSFGADVIGMTNVPEAFLAKEAGIAYATVAMVTDYDCWKEEHCSVDEIMKVMKSNNKAVHELIKKALKDLTHNPISFNKENEIGLMTDKKILSDHQLEILKVLFS